MLDYYDVLELRRDCSDIDVKKAYRKHALRNHPDKQDDRERDLAAERFQRIAEAYTVLSNPKHRAIFDQYGEQGLKGGAANGQGGTAGGWSFSMNPQEVFSEFFGTNSAFADVVKDDGGFTQTGKQNLEKAAPIENNLYCSLEELFLGATKKIKVIRQKLDQEGNSSFPEERVMTVAVKPGWRAGTKIKFEGEGDQKPRGEDGSAAVFTPGDVVFVLKEKPHPHFRRRKNDLVFTASISLRGALTGTTVEVPLLDGRVLPVAVSDIVSPGFQKVVKGEGMPKSKTPDQRGDLVLEFDIKFPDFISVDQKTALQKVLPM